MRANGQLRPAIRQTGLCLTLCRRAERAGQKHDLDAQRAEQRRERFCVLFRQNLRRGHECGLVAVFCRAVDGGGGHYGLAAAHIALHQPVHDRAGGKVAQNVADGRLLRAGQREAERGIERLHLRADIRLRGGLVPLAAHDGEPRREDKKLLKHQPPARLGQQLPVRGLVHRLVCQPHRTQMISAAHVLRQNLRQRVCTGRERVLHAFDKQLVGDARRERVDG